MIEIAFLFIQYGLAFVFIWTGVLIFKNTAGWSGLIEKSWVRQLLPASPITVMRAVAVFDIVVGMWLVVGVMLWVPALLAALHLASVLLVTGIFSPPYRDVGLLAMSIALLLYTAPLS